MVSIIITSYNKEKTIARAINSALNQSYKNCEVIVVDDCSTDKSLLICQKYGDKINIISNAINKGLSYSRQEGIRQAKGEFITFIDADDYLDSNAIEKCIKMQKINNADIVQMKISRKIGKVGLTIPFRSKYNTNKALDSCLYDESLFPIQCWGKLYKAELLKSIHQMEYNGFWGEDRVFNLSLFSSNPKIVYEASAKYNYSWGGSTSSTFDINALQEYKHVYQIKYDWANANGYEQHIPSMQNELIELLKYYIRHLINSGIMLQNGAIEYLQNELEQPFWNSFKLPSTQDLYSIENRSFSRILKKNISNLIK